MRELPEESGVIIAYCLMAFYGFVLGLAVMGLIWWLS